jgi:hypothetical protein
MARVRTVKPEFWTDRRVGECSVSARLLFIAALNFADDEGGLDRSAKQLKAQAFPYDDIDCEPLVQELLSVGLLIEYEVGGDKYLHIKNFRKHQRIDKPQKARIPVYEHSENVPRMLPDPSKTVQRSKGMEGKGREEKGKEKTLKGPVEQKLDRGPVDRVFDHWRSEFQHPKAGLDPKRRRAIQRALEGYDEPSLCTAISGYKLSPHHMGQNDQRTVYDDISLFLRDAEHIERGMNFARAPPVRAMSAVEIAQQNLRKSGGVANGSVVAEQDGNGEGHLVAFGRVLR